MTTTPRTVARPVKLEGWLQALAGAMTYTRRPDGTAYWHLSDASYWEPIREDLQNVCREAHRGEFPNDWRWELIGDIANRLLEYSEPEPDSWDADRFREISWDVADSLASYSTVQLADWVSDHAARGEFEDSGLVEGLSPSISTLLRWRQIEELQLMADVLISSFEDLLPE
jgi:hypothetical protein